MHTSLAAQLAQLELGHLNIERFEPSGTADLPDSEAVEQTLAAIWSDLYASSYGRAEPLTELIPAMLRAFLESDREFARVRRAKSAGS